MKTIRFDRVTASSLNSQIGNLTRTCQGSLSYLKGVYTLSLEDYKGISRKVYEEEAIGLFNQYEKVVNHLFALNSIIQEVSQDFLQFDVKGQR